MLEIKGDQLLWCINFLIKNPLHLQINLYRAVVLIIVITYAYAITTAYATDMQLMSKFNKGFRFLLCVIEIFSKYPWVIPLKDKKGVSIVNVFQKILDTSERKPNKIQVDKGSEFYNSSF